MKTVAEFFRHVGEFGFFLIFEAFAALCTAVIWLWYFPREAVEWVRTLWALAGVPDDE